MAKSNNSDYDETMGLVESMLMESMDRDEALRAISEDFSIADIIAKGYEMPDYDNYY